MTLVRSKGQISLNLVTMSISKIFIPNFVHVLTNKRKYIDQNFYSVAGVMLQGWDLGVLGGGSKTLAWGFAMAPHRLRILVSLFKLAIMT